MSQICHVTCTAEESALEQVNCMHKSMKWYQWKSCKASFKRWGNYMHYDRK